MSRIHLVADPRQNTVRIELSLPSDAGAPPRASMSRSAYRTTPPQMPAQLTIPKSAIVTKGGLPLVYAIDREGKARRAWCALGDAPDGAMQIVLSGYECRRSADQPPTAPGLHAGTQIMALAQPETVQNAQ